MSVERYTVFGNQALDAMLSEIFSIVEENYIRRTTYESDMSNLSRRISALEAMSFVSFSIDEVTGNLILSVPDNGDVVNISIVNDNLVLVSNETDTDKVLERYTFDISDTGYLMMTFT